MPLFQRLEFKSLLARVLSLSEGEQKHAEISGSGASKEKTPLEIKISELSKKLGLLTLIIIGAVSLMGYFQNL